MFPNKFQSTDSFLYKKFYHSPHSALMSVYTDRDTINKKWYIQAINYQNDWRYDIYEHETETQETAQIVNEAELEKAEFDKASTVASTQLKLKSKYAAMFSLKTIVSATLVLIILLSMALLSAPSRAWITGINNLASSCERMTTWLDKEEERQMQEGKTDTRPPGEHSFNAPRTVSVSV